MRAGADQQRLWVDARCYYCNICELLGSLKGISSGKLRQLESMDCAVLYSALQTEVLFCN